MENEDRRPNRPTPPQKTVNVLRRSEAADSLMSRDWQDKREHAFFRSVYFWFSFCVNLCAEGVPGIICGLGFLFQKLKYFITQLLMNPNIFSVGNLLKVKFQIVQ